jgi:hypothetical protein
MEFLPKNIIELVASEKHLNTRPKWDDKSDPRYFVFTVPLLSGPVSVGGFELRAKVSKQHVNRDAMLQLEFAASPRGRDRVELARCQWKPFETHRNKDWGPPGHELATFISQSHHHTFEHNFLPAEHRLRERSLPAAVPILPDPQTLSDFVEVCGKLFRIQNISLIDLPGVSADMFWEKLP